MCRPCKMFEMPSNGVPPYNSMIVTEYLKCCKHLSIGRIETLSVLKLLTTNLRSTDVKALFAEVFSGLPEGETVFLDWSKVGTCRKMTNNATFWVHLISRYLDFTDCQKPAYNSVVLAQLGRNLSSVGIVLSWADTLRVFLLTNIASIESLYAINLFLSTRFHVAMDTQCMKLMSVMADCRYTVEEYTQTMNWVLFKCCAVQKDVLLEDVHRVMKTAQETREVLAVKTMHMTTGRIRLRDRLSDITVGASIANLHVNTFEWFKTKTSFSSLIAYNTQIKAYFLMSQNAVDIQSAVVSLFSSDVASTISDVLVTAPDIHIIMEVISRVLYTKQASPQLKLFHGECFNSIPLKNKGNMTLSQIMQLYLVAYQCRAVWQDCWITVLPIMNAQLIRDVEGFVSKHPMIDHGEFIHAMSSFT